MELSRERRKLIEWCDLSVLSRDNEPHKDSECMSIRWGGTTHGLDPHKDPLSVSVSDGEGLPMASIREDSGSGHTCTLSSEDRAGPSQGRADIFLSLSCEIFFEVSWAC